MGRARAEQALRRAGSNTRLGMVRPALVYGPGWRKLFMLLKLPTRLPGSPKHRAAWSASIILLICSMLWPIPKLSGCLLFCMRDAEESSVRQLFRRLAGSLCQLTAVFNPRLAMSMARVMGRACATAVLPLQVTCSRPSMPSTGGRPMIKTPNWKK